jgi:hypothetical protein
MLLFLKASNLLDLVKENHWESSVPSPTLKPIYNSSFSEIFLEACVLFLGRLILTFNL